MNGMMMSKKKRIELQRQREQRRKELVMTRDWIHSHPHRVDPEVRPAAIDFLNNSIAELDRFEKNERPLLAGRGRLRDRLRHLVTLILTQSTIAGK
jgi:hypothetical protein